MQNDLLGLKKVKNHLIGPKFITFKYVDMLI
jgi:hypothetical protein